MPWALIAMELVFQSASFQRKGLHTMLAARGNSLFTSTRQNASENDAGPAVARKHVDFAHDEDEDKDGDKDDRDTFTCITDTGCRLFVGVLLDDFAKKVKFLNENQGLLRKQIDERQFLKQSVAFYQINEQKAAISCMEMCALIHFCEKVRDLTVFLRKLLDEESEEKHRFNDMVRTLRAFVVVQAVKERSNTNAELGDKQSVL
jgi:hypothetical protein